MRSRRTWCAVLCVMFVLAIMPVARAAVTVGPGDTGENVKKIQRRLIQYDYMDGTADGVYGEKTRQAVIKFQKKYGLTADGVVGPATAAKLGVSLSGSVTASSTSSSGGYSSSDVTLLARLVYAEARGEPYKGQVAVAAVVLNRVRSSEFPNTIAGVIYQKNAFSCVSDGQINLTPNAESKRAAQDALGGWDPSGGSLYYYNPNTASDSWIFSRTTVTVIGNHCFAV
ncbi:MAG TPA: spore cortex-lytic enzyme [Candidatus Fimadaptatus faecigallinarum]|uniref:Spore cortex-lytic enzyme n=1 Tax=Candidatus Fimadaptatus faecigallinarum TaxID=2840814 RepID=A0A9D1LRA1_9FIRM|nr:spore cortex-lytic enzyme [Candidatus Fimadaptatus faecigallinarum]